MEARGKQRAALKAAALRLDLNLTVPRSSRRLERTQQ